MQSSIAQFFVEDIDELSKASRESGLLVKTKSNLAILEDYIASVVNKRPMKQRKTFSQINKLAEEVLAVGSSLQLQEIVHKTFKSFVQAFFSDDAFQ